MIYLDYSATTKPDIDVVNKFNEVVTNYYANPNSNYDIAKSSRLLIEDTTRDIADYFKVLLSEIIYTSGASEANNLALKGIKTKGQIITTKLEHSSIITPLGYLQKEGYKISFVNLDNNGLVDLNHLKELLKEKTVLITIGLVSSELGVKQNINEISRVAKEIDSDIIIHSDITQAVGKTDIDLSNIDMASFSGHKFYTFKGIGGLIKKNHVKLTPLIDGGRSLTNYRAGTPQTELIVSMGYALNKLEDLKIDYVKELNDYIVNYLKKYNNIVINSNQYSIPHILNFSILNTSSDDTQEYFNKHNIYISTKTACSSGNYSNVIYAVTNDLIRASSSVRISLSKYTTIEEINTFLDVLDKYMESL